MSGKYTRAELKYVSGLIGDVLKAVGDKPAFIELHNLVEMLEVNLIDKYFREAFNDKPTDGIATLIQYHAIHLYDFSELFDKAGRKTKRKKDEQLPDADPWRKWNQLRDTISEMAENGGTGTQEDVCRYLLKYMDVLEQEE